MEFTSPRVAETRSQNHSSEATYRGCEGRNQSVRKGDSVLNLRSESGRYHCRSLRGGYFVALVAAERPARRVVFLASIIPELGASFLDQLARNSGIFCPSWIGKDPSKDDAAAMDFLFHDCAPEVARGAMTTRILLPLKQRYPLDQWPATKYSDIACSEDRTINPAWSRRVAHERLGIDPRDFGRPLPVSVEARRTRGNLIAKRLS